MTTSTSTTPGSPRPAARRRWRRSLIVVLALAFLGLWTWIGRARILERLAVGLAAEQAALDLRLAGLEVRGLSKIRVSRARVDALEVENVLRGAEALDVEIDIDLAGLVAGRPLVRAVRVAGLSIDLDLDALDSTAEGAAFDPSLFTGWPAIDVASLAVTARAGSARARSRDGVLALEPRAGGMAARLTAGELALENAVGAVSGALSFEATSDELGLRVQRARLAGLVDVSAASYARLGERGFEASLTASTQVGVVDVVGRSDGERLTLEGVLEDVQVARLLDVLGYPRGDYGGTWSARGRATLPFDDGARWIAEVEVTARDPLIAGRAADAIEGHFRATDRDFQIERALLLLGGNTVMVELARLPRAADLACEFLERATVVLDADLSDAPVLFGTEWSLPLDAPPHRVRARATLADGWLSVGRARAEIGASRIDVLETRLPVAAGLQAALLDPSTGFDLQVRSPESEVLARLILPADVAAEIGLAGAIEGSARLATAAGGTSARFDLTARDAELFGVPIDAFTARAAFEEGILAIDRFDARIGANTILAQGSVDTRARRVEGLAIDVEAPDLAELARALGLGLEAAPAGRARIRARVDGSFAQPHGDLEVFAEDLTLGPLDVSWAHCAARGGRDGIEVEDLAFGLPLLGEARARGTLAFGEDGAVRSRLTRLDLLLAPGSLTLAREARLDYAQGVLRVEHLELASGEGGVLLHSARLDDGICADLHLVSARVGRILRAFGLEAPVPLTLDGRASVSLARGDDGIDGGIDVELEALAPDLQDLRLPAGFRARGSVAARVGLAGSWRAPRGLLEIDARRLDLDDGDGRRRITGGDLAFRARVGDHIQIEQARLELGPTAAVDLAGRVAVALDLERLVRGELADFARAPLDLRARVAAPDLAPLANTLEILRRTEGALAADLLVRGTAGDPTLQGRVSLERGGLKLATTLPALSDVEIAVRLDGRRIDIERASGAWGGGHIDIAGGLAFRAADPDLDLRLVGTSLPILRSADVSLRSDVDVRVHGPWSALALVGTAGLRDARFEQRIDLERLRSIFAGRAGGGGGAAFLEVPPIREAPFATMSIELDVRSESPVRVRTPLVEARILPRIRVRGTGAAPLLSGSLELAGGRIALSASKLDLARGRADFDPGDPGRARIDITAEGRVGGYDVTARVTGTTDDPVVELSSIPPATQEDLLLLLLAGRPPGARGLAVDQARVVGEVASMVARDLAYEWFGDAGESFADRLELATGGDVSMSGADTIEVRFRLAGSHRGVGTAVYMRGQRDIYDRVNMGVRFVLRRP